MTDPERISDPVASAKRLPNGSAVIYRHFGKADRYTEAEILRRVTLEREQQFLIGADPDLAIRIGADGVHFCRDAKLGDPTLWRRRCSDWLISMAGLKGAQVYSGDLSVLDGLFISSAFPSRSPSAGKPVGVKRLAKIAGDLPVPVFALGGVNKLTAKKLKDTGLAGLAAVSCFQT